MPDPSIKVFELALGPTPPWFVDKIDFDPAGRRLDNHLDFQPGGRFPCPKDGCQQRICPAEFDTHTNTWRYLNFFQHECYLYARVPHARCSEHGVLTISVPWARNGSDFTLLFETLVIACVAEMPVKATARLVGEHDTRLWRVLHHYVEAVRAQQDFLGCWRGSTASSRPPSAGRGGYRNERYFKAMIYMIAGKLTCPTVHSSLAPRAAPGA